MATNKGTPSLPLHYAIVLFPGFQALDAFGPLDILNLLSISHPQMRVSLLAESKSPVPVKAPALTKLNPAFSQSVVPTGTYEQALSGTLPSGEGAIDVLLIPGGIGTRDPPDNIRPTVQFVEDIVPRVRHSILTVCTGSAVLAQTGFLDGRQATTNKMRFAYVAEQNPGVHWVKKARWVRDGDFWTSAGVSAGIDVTLAFVAEYYGLETARKLAMQIEWDWKEGEEGEGRGAGQWDPFYEKYFPAEG